MNARFFARPNICCRILDATHLQRDDIKDFVDLETVS